MNAPSRSACAFAIMASGLVLLSNLPSAAGQERVPSLLRSATAERVWLDRSLANQVLEMPPAEIRRRAPELRWLASEIDRRERSGMSQSASDLSCLDYSRFSVTVTLPAGFSAEHPGLSRAIADANTVMIGSVVDRRVGFADGEPVVLLLVKSDYWRSKGSESPKGRAIYVKYAPSRLRVAGVPVCRRAVGLPDAPRIGERVLAAAHGAPERLEDGGFLIDPGPNVVFERAERLFTSDRVAASTPAWRSLRRGDIGDLVPSANRR